MIEAIAYAICVLAGVQVGRWIRPAPTPTHWTVIPGREVLLLFGSKSEALDYIAQSARDGFEDATEWVARGVVVLGPENDPR